MPESDIVAPALTEKDRADLAVGLAAGVDWVALSFVRHRHDVEILREAMAEHGAADKPVVAKIEKPQAVENIDEILEVVDAIMVARGDLGVEVLPEQVRSFRRSSSRPPTGQASPSSPRRRCWTAWSLKSSPHLRRDHGRGERHSDGHGCRHAVWVRPASASIRSRPSASWAKLEDVEQSNLLKPRDLSTIEALSGPSHTVARCAAMAVQESDRPRGLHLVGRSAVLASKARMAAPILRSRRMSGCAMRSRWCGESPPFDALGSEHRRDDRGR